MAVKINSIPAAARTFNALSRVGHDLNSAVCDIIDNSITQGKAQNIHLWFDCDNNNKFRIRIYDDGTGMTDMQLQEAMRIGSKNDNYEKGDLSKYGMGMKTASLNQAHRLTVISKNASELTSSYCWDMHYVNKTDQWDLFQNSQEEIKILLKDLISERKDVDTELLAKLFEGRSMTAVLWDDLKDFQRNYEASKSTVVAQNFWHKTTDKLILYMRMIFHRFLTGENGARKTNIFFNSVKLVAFDPFCRNEEHTTEMELPKKYSHFMIDGNSDPIIIRRYILPTNPTKPGSYRFSSSAAWSEGNVIMSLYEAQGYYVYRNNRLIDFGGWRGAIRSDEHYKLARASIDLTDAHDDLFTLTIDKTKVSLPEILKNHLIDNVNQGFIAAAKTRYNAAEKKTANVVINDVRGKSKKVSHLSSALVCADNIAVTELTDKKQITITNQYGSKITDDMTYKMLEAGQKIISASFDDDTYFWKMVPSPDCDFHVLINKDHPFYDIVYGDGKTDKKATSIMDAFLFTMSFIELKCITDSNEFLFEQMKEVASSVLKKFVEEKIL